jgi:DNA-binding NarL/FixJ family response regulator
MSVRLVIADDHPIILEGLEQLFKRERDFEVVATCMTGQCAVNAIRRMKPDVAVLDVNMPDGDGLMVLETIKNEGLATRVVLLTATLDDDEARRAIKAGVQGIVLKEAAAVRLVESVRRVLAGQQSFDPSVMMQVVSRMMDQTLSPREAEIVKMVAAGMRNKEIAAKLAIGEGTVKTHLHTIFRKLNVETRSGLVRYAVDHDMV